MEGVPPIHSIPDLTSWHAQMQCVYICAIKHAKM